MKKTIIAICLILSGCASRGFDSNEYNYAIQSSVLSTRAIHQCGSKSKTYNDFVNELNAQTMFLFEYEKYHPRNDYSLPAVTTLRQLVIDFTKAPKEHSAAYCVHKLSEIQSASRALARTLSGIGFLDICTSDVMTRLEVYKTSLNTGKISKDEYYELVNDLTLLANADTALCTIQQQEAVAKAISAIKSVSSVLK